ncbi:MAG TPA: hypothetical protein VFX30_04445 [bacterium]|nr:hypothetical protein [bacterium]
MPVPNLSLKVECRKELSKENDGVLEKLAERYPNVDPSVREEALDASVGIGCGHADTNQPKDVYVAEARTRRDQALDSEIRDASMRANNRTAVARFFQGTVVGFLVDARVILDL